MARCAAPESPHRAARGRPSRRGEAFLNTRYEYKYIAALVSVFGLFMVLLDVTIVNVAIPVFATELDASTTEVQWVVTGFLLSVAVFIPVSGWIGDRFGTKRLFIFALGLFTAGSALCAAAWNVEALIAFRVIQGVGGGLLTPVGTAIVFRAFPPQERARASAIIVVPTTIAPASGPVAGGIILDYLSWPWIFLVNVPVGIAGITASLLFLQEHKESKPGRFDVTGFMLAAVGLAALLYGLAEAGERGLDDARVLVPGGAGLLLLAAFTVSSLRVREPMIDVRLFLNRMFTMGNITQSVGFLGFSGTLFLLPLILQLERGLTPLESGLVTFPQALGVMSMAPVMTRLYPRIGPRRLIALGLTVASLTTLPFVTMDLETNLWFIRAVMYVRGLSFGLLLVPVQTAAFATISIRETGRASAVFNATRQVAQSFGVAVAATLLTSRLGAHDASLRGPNVSGTVDAFQETFLIAALLLAAGAIVALFIRDRDAAPTMMAQRAPPEAAAPEPAPGGR